MSDHNEPQQAHIVRIATAIITGVLAGLTNAVADVILHHLTTGR